MKDININNYRGFKIYDESKEIAYAYNLDMLEENGENFQAKISSSSIQNNSLLNNIFYNTFNFF